MAKDDWYRRSLWTPADQDDFDARLKRARSEWNRAQYLVIQAVTLAATGQRQSLEAAVELARRAIHDHPHRAMLARAHVARGGALADLGRYKEALSEYRAAAAAQRAYPGVKDLTHLEFGELVVGLGRKDLYAEAKSLIEEFGESDHLFPINEFRHFYLRAVFANATGACREAQNHAQAALKASRKTSTQFRYHRRLGLFAGAPPDVLDELHRLAAV